MTLVNFTTYDKPHIPEPGHEEFSMWRYFSGIATARTIIITSGVATAAPGMVNPTQTELDNADAGTGENGKAIWRSSNETQTVNTTEGTILTTAGYTVT
jgi:hypothetical protein